MYTSLICKFNYGCYNRVGKTILRSNCCFINKLIPKYVSFSPENSVVFSPPWKVLFFGSDDFSLESLRKLTKELENGLLIQQLEIVTSVKHKDNVVQQYAKEKMLKVHNWPTATNLQEFDLGIVVSFGHLIPEKIISLFPLGMLNVHASILPRWRGAAPIVYAIMNGDTVTGVTVMQIKPFKFDIGGILKQAEFPLAPNATFPLVRNALASLGSEILLECLKELPICLKTIQEQPEEGVSYAPRISPSLAQIKWQEMTSTQIYNLWRALESIYPLTTKWHDVTVRLYEAEPVQTKQTGHYVGQFSHEIRPGYVIYHRHSKHLRVMCSDRKWISFRSIGLPTKKPMSGADFHNGYISKQNEEERYFI